LNNLPSPSQPETTVSAADVEQELLYAAYERMPTSLLLSIVVMLGYGTFIIGHFSAGIMLVWMTAGIGCSALRFALYRAFRRAAPHGPALRYWRTGFFIGAVASAASWSVGPTLLIQHVSGIDIAYLGCTLLSVCAVAASSMASQQAAMHTFFAVTLLPPAVTLICVSDGNMERNVGAVILAGFLCMVISGQRSYASMRAMLIARQQSQRAMQAATVSQQALEDSEQRYRVLAEWSPDPITVQRDGIIIYVNPAMARTFGATSAEQMIGKSPLDFVHPDSRSPLLRRLARIAAGAANTPIGEMKFFKLDGSVVDVEIHSATIIYDGAPAMCTTLRDITERKRSEKVHESLEAQLREAQKMQAIGTLAGGIAHDFNNIIATILGNAELARQDARQQPQVLHSIDEIHKAAARARSLVQQILSFSRPQATLYVAIPLRPIVAETIGLLRSTLPARVELSLHCAVELPNVLADANQIQQIVLNLCNNATQALRGDAGTVRVQVARVMPDAALQSRHPALRSFAAQHPDAPVCLSVSDNGCGMDAGTISRIFEPFFTTKPVNQGTGLGLSVVHGIVQAHGGVITVDSQVGMGACFSIYLPSVLVAAKATPSPVATDQAVARWSEGATNNLSGQGRSILYLDDDEALVTMVVRLLQRYGYRVSGFSNQQRALANLRATPAAFDLVISDYNMPGWSGLDVAREVAAIRADLPIVIVSGFIDEALRHQVGSTSVRELIFKEGDVEHLCQAIERLARADSAA
jgi:PAS domain S-box-containing protein